MIIINGSEKEGGGQILRTSLALSMITGKPFSIQRIRAGRSKPGLMRQHLTCVQAAAEICGAETKGAELNSQALTFRPKAVKAGTYDFSIGTAGATVLVLQTVLPALTMLKEPSQVTVTGGTHVDFAPNYDFFVEAFLPLTHRMGFNNNAYLQRYGFYPAGGGIVRMEIQPVREFQEFILEERGALLTRRACAGEANLPHHVVLREIDTIRSKLGWDEQECKSATWKGVHGHGNAITIALAYQNVTEVFTALGSVGKSAEYVACNVCHEVKGYLQHNAPVGAHLADQLLLPIVLGAGGRFVTEKPTLHTLTNINTLSLFLGDVVQITQQDDQHWLVDVKGMNSSQRENA